MFFSINAWDAWAARCLRVFAVFALSMLHAPLFAHDFWIEPSAFVAAPGAEINVRLREGEGFAGDALPRIPAFIREFFVLQGGVRRPVTGQAGAEPAGRFIAGAEGAMTIAYLSRGSRQFLMAEKFNTYLAEEGLEAILDKRSERKQSTAAGRETYVRCAKSLVRGVAGADGRVMEISDAPLGLPLELIAERDPAALDKDRTLPLRLLYQGRPIPGVLLVALNRADPARRQSMRTDADGRVRFVIGGGDWLIKGVHMIDAPAGSRVDWISYWVSLTFALPDESPAPAKSAANNTRASSDLVGSSLPRTAVRDARSPRRTPIS
jgi:Domain of unknown function (DUF4198)